MRNNILVPKLLQNKKSGRISVKIPDIPAHCVKALRSVTLDIKLLNLDKSCLDLLFCSGGAQNA